MKRIVCIVLTGLFLTAFSSYIKAEDTAESENVAGCMKRPQEGMMKHAKMKDSGKMMKMFHAMMIKNMVATEDGGVIVLVGNKLQKYDKHLVLRKEAEIQIDPEYIQKMIPYCAKKKASLATEEEKPEAAGELQQKETN